MRKILYALLVAILITSCAYADDDDYDDDELVGIADKQIDIADEAIDTSDEEFDTGDVIILDGRNFLRATADGDWFILFYVSWCGYCQRYKPIWQNWATVAKGRMTVAVIDCTISREFCGALGVRTYPAAYFRRGNKMYEYEGDKTMQNLVNFCQRDHQSAKSINVPSRWYIYFYVYWAYILSGSAIFAASSFAYLFFVTFVVKSKKLEAEKDSTGSQQTEATGVSDKKQN